ncbi:MAG: GNAT family N-acetyltransferase [Myxococcota bacterium]
MEDARLVVLSEGTEREAAFALRRRVFIGEQRVPPDLEYDDLDEPGSTARHVAVMAPDGAALATGRVVVRDGLGKMQRIAVERSHRRRGLGRRVMEALERIAAEQGATTARLASQVRAIPFYEALGYTAWGGEFMDAGIPHRWMDKVL